MVSSNRLLFGLAVVIAVFATGPVSAESFVHDISTLEYPS
jgi:hypothetical protein